jgi:hypothetical protein
MRLVRHSTILIIRSIKLLGRMSVQIWLLSSDEMSILSTLRLRSVDLYSGGYGIEMGSDKV